MYPSCVGNIGRREKAWAILDNCKYLCKERQKKAGQEYIFMDLKVSASEMISDVSARKIGVGVGRIIPTPVCKELSEHEIEDTIFRFSWKVGRKKKHSHASVWNLIATSFRNNFLSLPFLLQQCLYFQLYILLFLSARNRNQALPLAWLASKVVTLQQFSPGCLP